LILERKFSNKRLVVLGKIIDNETAEK